jgi:putative transposase
MPRTARAIEAGLVYHVLNRGNARMRIFDDYHFLTVCRYVEANALRARMVPRAELWQWSGLWRRQQRKTDLPLADWPEDRPRGWLSLANEALDTLELDAVRVCARRGRPYGTVPRVAATARRLGLGFALRGVGRPPKTTDGR